MSEERRTPTGTRRVQGEHRPPRQRVPEGQRPSGQRAPGERSPRQSRPQGEYRDAYGERSGARPPRQGRPPQRRQDPRRAPKKKSKAGKIVLFAVEIVVLLAMVAVLWTVLKTEKTGKVNLPESEIIINPELKEKLEMTSGDGGEPAMKGYRNIALFGVDSREGALTKNTRSDTIIIASINMDTGECKLVSVYRDTYMNLGNDSYNKCNAAYAKGGPKQAINMLNMNLDMNVTDFVTIGFKGLQDVIDALGGVEINVKEEEIIHLNNYQISMVGTSSDGEHFTANEGSDYIPVKSAGMQTLNGLQATAYCRIRYVGNDFQRTQRQRDVIQAIVNKAKKASPTQLTSIANDVFDEIYTSLDISEILEVLGEIGKYEIVGEDGFPQQDMLKTGTIGKKGSCVVPNDLYGNVKWLHEFLFDDAGYEPSSEVSSYSEHIKSDTSSYVN